MYRSSCRKVEPTTRHQPPGIRFSESLATIWRKKTPFITAFSIAAILAHLILRFGVRAGLPVTQTPLFATLAIGGLPLVYDLLKKLLRREFGSDLLAGISIVTSVLLGEYLAGSIVVLMLAGGETLENYAVRNASSVLRALAKRMPSVAHRKCNSEILDVALDDISVGDMLVVYPHDICPVDGVVIEGHGAMDESFLTGEPFELTKAPGSSVISGALQSAIGGMTLSFAGMLLAATGHLSPVAGALGQEAIDVLAVLNALRAALPPKELCDF